MATKDTVVQELVVNTLTQAQFDAAKEAGTLSPYELYGTPDASVRLPVLTPMWFDHIVNDVSWLRAETFSWHSEDKYKAVYEHLSKEIPKPESVQLYCWKGEYGVTVYEEVYTKSPTPDSTDGFYYMWGGELFFEKGSIEEVSDGHIEDINGQFYNRYSAGDMVAELPIKTQKEVVSGITIAYYQAEDGHKICLPDQEAKLSALYEATGIAWYYILDTENKQFKLPRTKWGFVGTRDTVGGYVPESLPDHNHSIKTYSSLFPWAGNGGSTWQGVTDGTTGNASDSNSAYQAGAPVQQRATQMYLYFYAGNFTQDAVEQTAGLNAEMFNGKLDIKLGNAAAETKATVVGWGMPDYSAGVEMTLSQTAETVYACPTDGFITIDTAGFNNIYCYLKINNVTIFNKTSNSNSLVVGATGQYAVSKGDVIKAKSGYEQSFASTNTLKFFPVKGVN